MTHQCMPKIFHGPHKSPPAPPPTYLMYGPLDPYNSQCLHVCTGRVYASTNTCQTISLV